MSAVGSSTPPSSAPVAMRIVTSETPTPVESPYSQADFDRDNAVFRQAYTGHESDVEFRILQWHFSSLTLYTKADHSVVQCHECRNHRLLMGRVSSVRSTHLTIMVLNKYLLDPQCPVASNPQLVYQRIMGLLPKGLEKIDEESRTEDRKRMINVSTNFYKKEIMTLAKYLIQTNQATDPGDAVRKLTTNTSCGSLVDALACDTVRLSASRV